TAPVRPSPPEPRRPMDRRYFLQSVSEGLAAAAFGFALPATLTGCARPSAAREAVDRRARVDPHAPVSRSVDPRAPPRAANRRVVCTADATGLQSFPDRYEELPLATQAEWAWHSFPNPEGYSLDQALTLYDVHGRQVPYADQQNSPAGAWLRENPHRLSLAAIGFVLRRSDGGEASADDLSAIEQRLDLWTGTLHSRFEFEGRTIVVTTCAHPERDLLAVRVQGTDLPADRLALRFAFPYGSSIHTGDPADWDNPERHTTEV